MKGGLITMDQYLSTVIIALITGIFSIITLIIQKKQDKVIDKIDEQTLFIEKEKALRQKLTAKEKERESLVRDIMMLILDTNLYIMKNNVEKEELLDVTNAEADKLKEKFSKLAEEIEEISKEYELLLDLSEEFQHESEKEKK